LPHLLLEAVSADILTTMHVRMGRLIEGFPSCFSSHRHI
jgi:hypothetical protein